MADDEKKKKQAEIDRKRAEVRARLEEASKAKKAKKGFMTPERKKKLRLLLRKKAAEELKKEQERKAAERRRIIEERCGKAKNIEDANEETIKRVLREYHSRINKLEDEKFDLEYAVKKKDFEMVSSLPRVKLHNEDITYMTDKFFQTSPYPESGRTKTEKKFSDVWMNTRVVRMYEQDISLTSRIENKNRNRFSEELKNIVKIYFDRMLLCENQKWDLEHEVRKKDYEINDLNSQVNDLRGKFVKPTLKKVSKYENKFAKLQKKAAEFNFRNQLKQVKKKEFTLEEEDKEKKPEWSKKGDDKKVESEESGAGKSGHRGPATPSAAPPQPEEEPPQQVPAEKKITEEEPEEDASEDADEEEK